MHLSITLKDFIRQKLNEEIKTIDQLIKTEAAETSTNKPDWLSQMRAEFEEITKDRL
jgi:sensor domain CHASE-containing protein